MWSATAALPPGRTIHFKYVITRADSGALVAWGEDLKGGAGGNLQLRVTPQAGDPGGYTLEVLPTPTPGEKGAGGQRRERGVYMRMLQGYYKGTVQYLMIHMCWQNNARCSRSATCGSTACTACDLTRAHQGHNDHNTVKYVSAV